MRISSHPNKKAAIEKGHLLALSFTECFGYKKRQFSFESKESSDGETQYKEIYFSFRNIEFVVETNAYTGCNPEKRMAQLELKRTRPLLGEYTTFQLKV